MAFSGNFTTNLAPQCRALKIEKLKTLLRVGAINNWCICFVVIDIGSDIFSLGMSYVVLSRVKI